jgi:molecular chaperone GrpE (heat shock protein)
VSEGDSASIAQEVRQALREELDEVMPHLLAALKRDRAFDALADRLRDAEHRLKARRERPVAVALLRMLHRLRHLDFDPAAKQALDEELVGVLATAGYEEFGAVGEPFDPDRHQALAGETSQGRGVIVEVYASGLACLGEVASPAQVRVAAQAPILSNEEASHR